MCKRSEFDPDSYVPLMNAKDMSNFIFAANLTGTGIGGYLLYKQWKKYRQAKKALQAARAAEEAYKTKSLFGKLRHMF